jgi:D-glycero-alpha-D-manno-heptose-7-phosphate kinase
MLFRARAPLRLSFAGGGTDVSPYAEEHGGAVLNATIDKHAYASLEVRDDYRFTMCDLDDASEVSGCVEDEICYSGTLDLAKAVIRRLGVRSGFNLRLHSDAPWGSGLGSSSTHVAAVLGVFSQWLRLGLPSYELAEMAYEIERVDLGQAGGRQDQYSATFGGFNFMEFSDKGAVINPLRIKAEVMHELHYRLLLCFLGRTRRSSEILKDQVSRYSSGESESVEALHRTKELAYEMKRTLLRGQIDAMGELLNEGWKLKKRFTSLITNPAIDEIYADARKHGAIGGKLLGAGGGGHMLFLCPSGGSPPLATRLSCLGIQVVPFSFEQSGLTTWEVTNGW